MKLSQFPLPADNAVVGDDKIYTAVRAFIKAITAYTSVFVANQNRVALPSDNKFCFMSIVGQYRNGTSIEGFTVPDDTAEGILTEAETLLVDVDINCYSDIGGMARRQCQAIHTAACSYIGTRFFYQYGFGCLYATDIKNIQESNSNKQFVDRWLTTLRLSFNSSITASVPYIDTATINLKNVDVEIKP